MKGSSNRPDGESLVDVFILNWNGWRDTLECLESVLQLDYPRVRVVVCDNGSTDDSLDRIRAWAACRQAVAADRSPLPEPVRKPQKAVALVEYGPDEGRRGGDGRAADADVVLIAIGANLGFAGGNNVGMEFSIARGEASHIWLLNNDMVVARDSLSRMVALAESNARLGCVGATLLEYLEPDVVQAAGGGRLVRWQGMPRPHSATGARRGSPAAQNPDRLDFITMGCLVAPMTVVRRVGLIDPRFFIYCEDIDYSLRVRAAGLDIGFAPAAEVWHKGSASMQPGSARHDYHMVRSSLLLVGKFHRYLMPIAFAHSFLRCAAPKVVRRQPERLRAVIRAYVDVLKLLRRPSAPSATVEAARPGT